MGQGFGGIPPLTVNTLEIQLQLPDLWQQEALRHLRGGRDVIVAAPTGAGKTHVFELLVESGFSGKSVFTVPTRALANDKRREWSERGWNVGIATGDVAENLDAPVVVATLETQISHFLRRTGPDLFVVDEYQMLADDIRGVSYELALAMLPPSTRLLLLSGSVANPEQVAGWLGRIGRDVALIDHRERPVPQEEVFLDSLPDRVPNSVTGYWPRLLARALMEDLGPVLIFAPRRRAAEQLARVLAAALPVDDPLVLTAEQKRLAGDRLAKMLKSRVAYHHSGLGYQQRAGLVEPLAKAGQLRIVVATTGLAAGINFSMRSVLVTDREYQISRRHEEVRADGLLQMFGRAGRRGLDDTGFVLVAPGRPRLTDARPLAVHRSRRVDWPSLIGVMRGAVERGLNPFREAVEACGRLFSLERVPLGVEVCLESGPRACGLAVDAERRRHVRGQVAEILNSKGEWQSRPEAQAMVSLETLRIHRGDRWRMALECADTLEGIGEGSLCRLPSRRRRYGRLLSVASRDSDGDGATVRMLKSARRRFAEYPALELPTGKVPEAEFRERIAPRLAAALGGRLVDIRENGPVLGLRLDFGQVEKPAWVDVHGVPLADPPERLVSPQSCGGCDLRETCLHLPGRGNTPAWAWRKLGLVDAGGTPTRRGDLFAFFHHGEGLAIAAALEDETYPVEDLVYDLANVRAGHRFAESGVARGSRLAVICRETYPLEDFPGYLEGGVPVGFGDGASEAMRGLRDVPPGRFGHCDENLRPGDVERAWLEWRSLLRQIARAPAYPWDRWEALRAAAARLVESETAPAPPIANIPQLPPSQRQRRSHRLRFPR